MPLFFSLVSVIKRRALLRNLNQKSAGIQVLHPSWGKAGDEGCPAPWAGRRRKNGAARSCLFPVAAADLLTRHVSHLPCRCMTCWGVGRKVRLGIRRWVLWDRSKWFIKICFVIFTVHHTKKVGGERYKNVQKKRKMTLKQLPFVLLDSEDSREDENISLT